MPLPDPVPTPPAGYLDAVGGQPLLPAARAAWLSAADQGWADPARLHPAGRRAGLLLDTARASLAARLRVRPDDLYLTSSGPTAVQLAVAGLAARSGQQAVAVVSAVETMAVQQPAARFCSRVEQVAVDATGRVDLSHWHRAINAGASLACLQAANPEVGTRQPLAEASAACREAGVPLLVHAVQVLGRDPVPEHWDVLAASARDWGGPAGVGLIAVRPGAQWRPDQSPDRGWVQGFPDVPGAVGAATAWEYLEAGREAESQRAHAAIAILRAELAAVAEGVHAVGSVDDRLPHVLTLVIDDIVGEQLVHELARRGISVASGSACTTDARMASSVLAAMGLPDRSSLRISLPLGFSDDTIASLLANFAPALQEVR